MIDRITEYFTYKMDQLIHYLTEHFRKHNNNIKKLYNQLQQNEEATDISISKDIVFKRAFSIFCKEK